MINRREQIISALYQECNTYSEVLNQAVPIYDSLVTGYLKEYHSGEMPLPNPYRLVFPFRSDIWQGALQSGALEILEVDLTFRLASFYSMMRFVSDETRWFDDLISRYNLPNLDEQKSEFYDGQTKKFKVKYSWYPEAITNIQRYLIMFRDEADTLLNDLKAYSGE